MAAWSEDAHPRASAGTATGGQFAAGGSAGSSSPHAHRKAAGHATAGRKAAGKGALGFDAGRNTGTGYGTPGGDKRVHQVQQLLIRLGVTDGKGRRLADDGKFGPLTTQAVKKAQAALGMPTDGKVTARFLRRLATLKSLPVRAKASVTAAELLFGPSAAWEAWDADKHPRGYHGRFGAVTHALAKARRHGEVEHDVFTGPHGNIISVNKGEREVAELKAIARAKQDLEDRADQRLRFGEQTHGHWFMIKGPRYWVKQDSKPGWHNGYYYWPGKPFPVTPPREDWENRHSYNGYPSTSTTPGTPLSSLVPDDVWRAAHKYKEERVGKRAVGHGGDRTVKSENFQMRKNRVGLGSTSDEVAQSKRFHSRKVRTKRQGGT